MSTWTITIVIQWRIQDFPDEGGGANPGFVAKPIMWQDFRQKLHENERNWAEGASLTPLWIRQCECDEIFL